jgi:UDP-N-acetyl-D-glucosamine dehydrogenase
MPQYVVDRTMHALNEQKKPANGARVLILGLAYKPDVDDTRESPAFEIIELFRELGSAVDYSDPHVPESKPVRRGDLGMKSVELTPDAIASLRRHRGRHRSQGVRLRPDRPAREPDRRFPECVR